MNYLRVATFSLGLASLVLMQAACKGKFAVSKRSSTNSAATSTNPSPDPETPDATPPASFALTSVPDHTFATGTQLTAGVPMPDIDVDAADGGDAGLTYTCHFDTTIDGVVGSGTDCADLPGTVTFTAATGVLAWTPRIDTDDAYEVKVTATADDGGSAAEMFVLQVARPYTKANLLVDLDARYATGLKPATSSQNIWQDLTLLNNDGTLTGAAWAGAGVNGDPYRLIFDGNSHVGLGSVGVGQTEFLFDMWLSPANAAGSGIIASNKTAGGDGFALQQSSSYPGQLELVFGGSYSAYVQSLNPLAYWRLNDTTAIVVDAMGNYNGTISGGYTQQTDGSLLAKEPADKATLFDATTVINAGDIDAFDDLSAFTMTFWVKPAVLTDSAVIIMKQSGEYGLRVHLDQGAIYTNRRMVVALKNGSVNHYRRIQNVSPACFTNNVWTFVAIIYDGAGADNNAKLKVYCDASPKTMVGPADALPTSLPEVNVDLKFGHVTNAFNGDIDEFAFFNYPLTQAQVQRMYKLGSVCRSTITTLEDSKWHHVAGRFTNGGTLNLEVNGISQCSLPGMPTDVLPASANLTLGATPAGTDLWSGAIANFRLYSLSSSVASTNFVATADRFRESPMGLLSRTNLVVHLDAANAGYGFLGAYPDNSCGPYWTSLPFTWAVYLDNFYTCGDSRGWNGTGVPADPYRLVFDGVANYIDTYWYLGGTSFSLGFWIKAPAQGQVSYPVAHGDADTGYQEFVFSLASDAATNKLTFSLSGDGTSAPGSTKVYQTAQAVFDDKWHYVAVTTGCGDGDCAMKVYVDGKLDANGTWLSQPVIANFGTNSSYGVLLGAMLNASALEGFWSGSVAMFSLWDDRVLSQEEITQTCQLYVSRFENATCE